MRPPASIPSPTQGVWHLGPVPIRGYAVFLILGIVVAIVLADHRWRARGGARGTVIDVATLAVPFGLVGGRAYHVLSDWSDYFGPGARPAQALEIWRGGLGIPGAVALGTLGAFIACRHRHVALPPMADAIAPGLVIAQAVGRWGNYVNQELYGRASHLPWALRIDAAHAPNGVAGTFQPTFLYESVWDGCTAVLLLWADRRWRLGHGRVFALYLFSYGAGRGVIELARIDPAHRLLGLRLNDWTSILACVGGLVGFVMSARRHPGREIVVEPEAGREHRQSEAVHTGE
jgi:prolipoprotein diacylglyceryl transferase